MTNTLDYSNIRTGDVLLFQSNVATSFILRTFTSSNWNHVGIAIRIVKDKDILVTVDEGDLYIFELNSGARYDILTGKDETGLTLTHYSWTIGKYNAIYQRPLKHEYQTPQFLSNVATFIKKYHGYAFSTSFLPFISVWLGIPFAGVKRRDESGKREMFCSEMLAYFYDDCLGEIHAKLQGEVYVRRDFAKLFGSNSPKIACLFQPAHFSRELSPKLEIFDGHEFIIYKSEADTVVVLLQPIILMCLILILIWMLLRNIKV